MNRFCFFLLLGSITVICGQEETPDADNLVTHDGEEVAVDALPDGENADEVPGAGSSEDAPKEEDTIDTNNEAKEENAGEPLDDGGPKIRIVGGDIVKNRDAFFYQASLRYKVYNFHFCGATIIDSRHLLTAAHCVINEGTVIPPSTLIAVVGDLNTRQETDATIYRTLEDIFTHNNFSNITFENDIAVLRLSEEFDNWTPMVRQIPLTSTTPLDDTSCTVSGWGTLHSGGQTSEDLRYVSVPIVNLETCKRRYGNDIFPGMLCAGYPKGGKDACQGDSGGPLVCDNLLAGVVSWGQGCADPEFPGIYADVALYREWIDEQLARSTAAASSLHVFATVCTILLVIFQCS